MELYDIVTHLLNHIANKIYKEFILDETIYKVRVCWVNQNFETCNFILVYLIRKSRVYLNSRVFRIYDSFNELPTKGKPVYIKLK